MSFVLPYSIWLLQAYFKTIPTELEDAARMDGCNRFQVANKIIIPLSIPGLTTAAIIAFLLSWGEFLFALLITETEKSYTSTVVAGMFATALDVSYVIIIATGYSLWFPPLSLLCYSRSTSSVACSPGLSSDVTCLDLQVPSWVQSLPAPSFLAPTRLEILQKFFIFSDKYAFIGFWLSIEAFLYFVASPLFSLLPPIFQKIQLFKYITSIFCSIFWAVHAMNLRT